nr:site-specific integrase [Streptomyces sp. ADI98-10]
MSMRTELREGRVNLQRIGSVVATDQAFPPWTVLDSSDMPIGVVVDYLRSLALGSSSPSTCRSYAYDLLRWFRVLWQLGIAWDRATVSEVECLVGWMRTAVNPQRERHSPDSPPPGSVNLRTGKQTLGPGYAARTINHALTVISGFYEFHAGSGAGPVVNPVPASKDRRAELSHRSPMEAPIHVRRARLRQRVPQQLPRSLPDGMWDELFEAMKNDRDRALLSCYVSSGARAEELLGIEIGDVDWAGQQIYVVSKGTKTREPVPASPDTFRYLAAYLSQAGVPKAGEKLWRALRGDPRPLTYSAMRRVLQRANAKLQTNWTLHDLRHTAATRMANDPKMTLPEVQRVMRHAKLDTTGIYLTVRLEEMTEKLQDFYTRPRQVPKFAPGYDPEDVRAVFGG